METTMNYPDAPMSELIEELHGNRIPDPYRPLEDIDHERTRVWIEAENRLTASYLETLGGRAQIRDRLRTLWDFDVYHVPQKKGGRYFFLLKPADADQASLCWCQSLNEKPKVLIDPNGLSADGTVSLTGFFVSKNGESVVYCLSVSGSDWQEWRIRDVATGQDLSDKLQWIKFSGAAWTPDHSGFYYCRYDQPAEGMSYKGANYNQKLYYHRLNTPQTDDELIYERPDQKEWGFHPEVTDDGRYLVLSVWRGTDRENGLLYQDLHDPAGGIKPLRDNFDGSYLFLGSDGSRLFVASDLDAPNSRVVAIDVAGPVNGPLEEIVAESDDALQFGVMAGSRFLLLYLHDAHSRITVFERNGKLVQDVPLPGIGSVSMLWGDDQCDEAFFGYTSFTVPPSVYRIDLVAGTHNPLWQPVIDVDADKFVTRQVFYSSPDGTQVPMFISHRKDLEINGDCPVFLYGYGGFDNAQTPAFSASNTVWMEMGGVYALANIRGGGEYGKAWHRAGTKLQKQNVFDDFVAAAEWLVTNKYTTSKRIAIGGRSNGGLLTGVCLTQRPDLYGAVLVGVGVLDMLRYHKFTIGWAWVSDYGSPDNPEEFAALLAYSPYHNIRSHINYPPTFITTGDHDDRVFPAHSFKFAARLQAEQAGEAPILIRIDTKAGHGMGKPTSKLINESADVLTFLYSAVGE
jgi:prolyl oligopeptidase